MTTIKRRSGQPAKVTTEQVVASWRAALQEQPHRALTATAEELQVERTTVWRHLQKAKDQGLIEASTRDSAGVGKHQPRHACWSTHNRGASWLACGECRQEWPCETVKASQLA